MMHVLRIAAIIAFVTLCTLLPFLPGSYDSLAVPLSMMARMFGYASLLLVPVGVLWLATRHHAFAVVALIAWAIVWAVVTLVAATLGSLSLGVITLAIGVFLTLRMRTMKNAPLYLMVVPIAVALLQWMLIRPMIEFSRSRAIRNSEPLIADIEKYRAARGHYPPSLLSVWKDYKPSVIGIDRYHYEPSGDAYNLVFEQLAWPIGTQEFVVYNPRDRQTMTSHAMDLLEFTGRDLELRRGFYAVRDTQHLHWKYFWFD